MVDHPQVTLWHRGQPVPVDRGVADLVSALWAAGIDTVYSCQGGPPAPEGSGAALAYVAFRLADLERFDALICDQPSHWQRETGAISGFVAVRMPPADLPGLVTALRGRAGG